MNELHKVLLPPRALFAAGKFEQYKRDIPYSTLAQAFQSLVRPLLAKSDIELADWCEALREALGPNGQLMVDLVPELRLIIGEQAPVPEQPPQDAHRRFQLVLRRFFAVFARADHPLALFLDDLQWLDAATLDLLEDLLTHPDVRHVLLIGAYRDNEVTAGHPLLGTSIASEAPEQRYTRSSSHRSPTNTWDTWLRTPSTLTRTPRRRWRNWCTRRPRATPSLSFSFSPRWSRKE